MPIGGLNTSTNVKRLSPGLAREVCGEKRKGNKYCKTTAWHTTIKAHFCYVFISSLKSFLILIFIIDIIQYYVMWSVEHLIYCVMVKRFYSKRDNWHGMSAGSSTDL